MQIRSIVECVKIFHTGDNPIPYTFPVMKVLYVVRSIYEIGGVFIRLEEIICPMHHSGYFELGWHIDGFKEVQPPMKIDLEELLKIPKIQLV